MPSPARSKNSATNRGGKLMRAAVLLCLWIVSPTASVRGDDALTARLQPLIDAHKGDVAIAVKHLKTSDTFSYRADEPMPTASLIKLSVMIEAYQQAHDGKL